MAGARRHGFRAGTQAVAGSGRSGRRLTEAASRPADSIPVGKVTGLYGIKGWVRVESYTQPPANIVGYSPWRIWRQGEAPRFDVVAGHAHKHGVVAKLAGIDDRDAASELIGATIAIAGDQLEPLGAGEYYWAELVGLEVVNLQGQMLGVVDRLLETGAHDVLVVRGERERLIPFVLETFIEAVDLERRAIRVDWAPED